MRNLRLAYKQEEQSKPGIFENLNKHAFPLSNGQVSTPKTPTFLHAFVGTPKFHVLLVLFISFLSVGY